jgi:phosphoribosylglycinamide formyltransferase 1
MSNVRRLAIFASGSGTNAENIIRYFQSNRKAAVAILFCNNAKAYVLQKAQKHGIKTYVFSREEFYNTDTVEKILTELKIDLIVLAGFLWLLPEKLVKLFPHRIINIHPALLPKHGGKGHYGLKVHEAVISNKEEVSGITIHYVNDKFDEGEIIAQFTCAVNRNETPDSLAAKVHKLEYEHYPKVIEQLLEGQKQK